MGPVVEASLTEAVPRRNRPVPAASFAIAVTSNVQLAPDARGVGGAEVAGVVSVPKAVAAGFENASLYVNVVVPAGTAKGSMTAFHAPAFKPVVMLTLSLAVEVVPAPLWTQALGPALQSYT